MTTAEIAYLAGIIDGEGSIDAYRGRGNTVSLRLRVSNTDRALMDWLVATCGGSYRVKHDATVGPIKRNRTVYDWQVTRLTADPLLRAVLPYLIVKRHKVEIWLQLSGLIRPWGASEVGNMPERLALLAQYRAA